MLGGAQCQDTVDQGENLDQIGNTRNDSVVRISNTNSLIWVNVCLNGQQVPAMVDSGANPNCISLRCVQGSHYLKHLTKVEYSGKQIVDANGEPIQPSYVIKCKLLLGTPCIEIETEFVVIDTLPFSCIIGQTTLHTFSSWEVSNTNKLLTINKSHIVPFFDSGNTSGTTSINLITSQKTTIPPFSSTLVDIRASGLGLDHFRPQSSVNVIVEGR